MIGSEQAHTRKSDTTPNRGNPVNKAGSVTSCMMIDDDESMMMMIIVMIFIYACT